MATLYYYPSNASMAPHMVLEEIGAPFELHRVDRESNAHKSPAYLRLNPNGAIPTYVDGDLVLFEAAAICLHLADTNPAAALAPPLGSAERAQFYKWLIHLTNTVQAELLTYFYPERLAEDSVAATVVKAHAETRLGEMFDRIEAALAAGGPYLLGARFSAADLYLLMVARWTRGMKNPARNRPALRRLLDRLIERPAVNRAFATEKITAPLF
ncbi:MAG TPA: glutathione S-transferase family protein [Stellaceae bacterium]|jgi:glutathione S-transferase|nr:glutathione S-transferase family protein [Stellaceae bacterium]